MPDLVPFNQPRVFPLTLAAGATSGILNVTGRRVYALESSFNSLSIRFNQGGEWVPFMLALGYTVPPYMQPFQGIEVRNDGANTTTVSIIVSELGIEDHRVNVLENRNGAAASLVPNGWNWLGITGVADIFHVAANPNRAAVIMSGIVGADSCTLRFYNSESQDHLIGIQKISLIGVADPSNPGLNFFRLDFKGEFWIEDAEDGQVVISELCYS